MRFSFDRAVATSAYDDTQPWIEADLGLKAYKQKAQ